MAQQEGLVGIGSGRPSDFGIEMYQGNLTTVNFKVFNIAYIVNPKTNLKINLGYRVRKENEWLIWTEDNKFGLYDSEQNTVSIGLNWFRGIKHEIRLKSQFVALQADNPQSLISDSGGYLYEHNY